MKRYSTIFVPFIVCSLLLLNFGAGNIDLISISENNRTVDEKSTGFDEMDNTEDDSSFRVSYDDDNKNSFSSLPPAESVATERRGSTEENTDFCFTPNTISYYILYCCLKLDC